MQKVVSFSGGRTSAYLVWLMEKTKKAGEKIAYIFMDTGAEHQKTYDFVRAVSKHFGVEIICLRVDINPELGKANGYKVVLIDEIGPDLKPWAEMIKKYGVPYFGGAFCTDRMKLGPFTKYCNEHFGKGNYETWLGIRADEPSRFLGAVLYKLISGMAIFDYYEYQCIHQSIVNYGASSIKWWIPELNGKNKKHADVFIAARKLESKTKSMVRYLAEISNLDKGDIVDWWEEQDFDLGIGEWLGNCVFCMKKSDLKLTAAQRDEPASYIDFIECINSDDVRIGEKAGSVSSMYRRKRSLEQVIATFDGSTGDEIKSRIRGGKMIESGSCSESCEVFNCSI
ncbi:MAG: phosphoadenosine phosphosulfate reductase family protein [Aeromonas veronii]